MTTTQTLTVWLLEQIEADEKAAREASAATEREPVSLRPIDGGATAGALSAMEHFVRHDPARVLRQCAALRAILDEHKDARQRMNFYNRRYHAGELTTADDLRFRLDANMRWVEHNGTLRALATIYAGHPDYDPSWRP